MNGLTVVLLASFALVANAFPQPDTQIVGGKDAAEGAHPYIVSLNVGKTHYCGGSIIHKRYIVTAAHCIIRYPASVYTVLAGSNHLSKPYKVYQVEELIPHPEYNARRRINDVGLIRLAEDIEYDEKIQPIQIRDIFHVAPGKEAIAAGWGRLRAFGPSPNDLQEVTLNIISQKECMKSYLPIQNTHICTFTKYGVGVCNGDSGGPLVVDGELVGLVSFGRPCAVGHADIYTRAYSYKEWITENIVE